MFPPVRLPYALPHLPDLRQLCPAFRKQSVAGLLLLPPTCPPPHVDLILQIWPDRRVARQGLVITPGDRLRRPQKLALHPLPGMARVCVGAKAAQTVTPRDLTLPRLFPNHVGCCRRKTPTVGSQCKQQGYRIRLEVG